jgi:hypothetical protein
MKMIVGETDGCCFDFEMTEVFRDDCLKNHIGKEIGLHSKESAIITKTKIKSYLFQKIHEI